MTISLEELFATTKGAGIAQASALQRAICRAAEGLPLEGILDEAAMLAHFGCMALPLVMARLVVVVAGVRGGKSFFAACGAIHDALSADCSRLKPHELPRHAIVAPTVDNAAATFRILCGIIEGSPLLRRLVNGEPTADTLTLRRPDGRKVEIVVVAAHRGGTTLRSRWLAGATLEETALFGVESTGAVVNAEEILRAAEARLLPGTQVRIVSSPMGRQGLLYDLYRLHFGKPSVAVLVVHAPSRALNPITVTQAMVDALRARDPDAAAREYDAEWIDGDTAYLHSASVDASVRVMPLVRPPDATSRYEAAMDSATRGNAWTLSVARIVDRRAEVSLAKEWIGSRVAPLSPEATLTEIAELLRPYHVTTIATDSWSLDALQDHARRVGLTLVARTNAEQNESYAVLQSFVAASLLELPPVEHVAGDLKMMRKVLTPGSFKIVLPRTADGRHCDFAPSIALAVAAAAGRGTGRGMSMYDALRIASGQHDRDAAMLKLDADLAEIRDI